MKITNSTPIQSLPQVSTIGQLKTFLCKQGGLSNDESNAIVENALGKGVLDAMKDNNIYDKKAKPTANTTMFGYRFSKALKAIVTFLMTPVLEAQEEENQAKAQVELEQAIKDWEKRGRRGRKPGQKNGESPLNPLNAILKEANTETRSEMGFESRGRIPFDAMIEFDAKLRKTFASKLKAHNKDNELPDTIENLVATMIEAVDTTNIILNEIKIAAKEADRSVRSNLGLGPVGRISGENVAVYNKEAKTAFRDSLKTIKETYGSLPSSMDDLQTEHLVLYVLEDETESKPKTEAKGKNKPKKEVKKPKGGKKAQAETEPVTGEVEQDNSDEADANAAVAAALESQE